MRYVIAVSLCIANLMFWPNPMNVFVGGVLLGEIISMVMVDLGERW